MTLSRRHFVQAAAGTAAASTALFAPMV
ncbi:MAG: twin-arginine translocation signal domain-containing protein, partial [Burkholderiaceae bacterium]|nr:twin-arginine translocation signal domain-containing protein [Burkholderiaceae bacterium]